MHNVIYSRRIILAVFQHIFAMEAVTDDSKTLRTFLFMMSDFATACYCSSSLSGLSTVLF